MRGKHQKENGTVNSIKDFFKRLFWTILAENPEEHGIKRYPKGKEVEAVYKAEAIYEKGEDHLPTKTVIGHIYTLSCPICGRPVKRSHEFCAECGNKVRV